MKEFLTSFYQKHKTFSLSEKLWNKMPSAEKIFMLIGTLALISTLILNLFHINIVPISNSLGSIMVNSFLFFVISFTVLMIPFTITTEVVNNKEKKFKIKMRKIFIGSQKDSELHTILEKINLIYWFYRPDSEIIGNNSYKNAIEQFENTIFSNAAFDKASEITCDIEKLNEYYEKNKELIQMPNEELMLMIKKRMANLMLKAEQEKQEKLDFMKTYSDLPNKDEAILKLTKKLTLSL